MDYLPRERVRDSTRIQWSTPVSSSFASLRETYFDLHPKVVLFIRRYP
jgi:hypothetical protein